MRRWRPWLVSLVVIGCIVWYLLSQIDPTELVETAWAHSFSQLGVAFEDAILSGILGQAVSQVVSDSLGICAVLDLMWPAAARR